MKEIWKDIDGLSGCYQVSSHGRVRSVKRIVNCGHGSTRTVKGMILKQTLNRYGYYEVRPQVEGKKHLFRVHRLVAIHFIPNHHDKPHVNHIDCNKTNNYPENLEWVTNAENVKHAVKNNLNVKGEKSHHAILSRNDVLQIRSLLEQGFATNTEIAKAYNISMPTVSNIKNRDSWRHL